MSEVKEHISKILITEEQIKKRVKELGGQISGDYAGKNPILATVLQGAVVFLSDLMREISIPVILDFLSVSSYAGHTPTGVVRILKDLEFNIEDKHVILVEDIVDTGFTLDYLLRVLKERNPADIRVCALLDKKSCRVVNVPIDYVGFETPDEFVVGYGMDYDEKYRNFPFVAVLKKEIPTNSSMP